MNKKLASLIALSTVFPFDIERYEFTNIPEIKSIEPKTYKASTQRDLYTKKLHKKKIKARHKKKGHGRQ